MMSSNATSMISRISALITLAAALFLTASTAFAQDAAQPTEIIVHRATASQNQPVQVVINDENGQPETIAEITVHTRKYNDSPVTNQTSDNTQSADFQISDEILNDRSGMLIGFGLGYGGLAAAGAVLSIGYSFNEHFALSFDANANYGISIGVDLAVVPKYQLFVNNFRLTAGVGVGFIYYSSVFGGGGLGIELKPQLQFDWFVNKNWALGFGFDWNVAFDCAHSNYHYTDSSDNPVMLEFAYAYFHASYQF